MLQAHGSLFQLHCHGKFLISFNGKVSFVNDIARRLSAYSKSNCIIHNDKSFNDHIFKTLSIFLSNQRRTLMVQTLQLYPLFNDLVDVR